MFIANGLYKIIANNNSSGFYQNLNENG